MAQGENAGTVQRVVDHALGVAKESVKAVAREAIRGTGSFLNAASAQVLQCLPGGSSTLVAGRHLGWDAAQHSIAAFRPPQLPAWMQEGASSLNRFLLEAAELVDGEDLAGAAAEAALSPSSTDDDAASSIRSSEGGGDYASADGCEDDLDSVVSSHSLHSRPDWDTLFSRPPSAAALRNRRGWGSTPDRPGVSFRTTSSTSSTGGHSTSPPLLLRSLRKVLLLLLWPFILFWRLFRRGHLRPHPQRRRRMPLSVDSIAAQGGSEHQQLGQDLVLREHTGDPGLQNREQMSPRLNMRERRQVRDGEGRGQRRNGEGIGLVGSGSSNSLTQQLLASDLGRTITGAMDYFHVTQHLSDFQRRGLLEELQVMMEVFIERCFDALKKLLLFCCTPWTFWSRPSPPHSRVPSHSFQEASHFQPQSALPSGAAPATNTNTPMGAASAPPPSAPFAPQRNSDGFLDARTCEDIVREAGYPFERIRVVTEDGYILYMERIPRKDSRKALYLQHGVFDSSMGWVSNGVVGSQAFAAHDQGYDVYLGNMRGYASGGHMDQSIGLQKYWAFSVNDLGMVDVKSMVGTIHEIKTRELRALEEEAAGAEQRCLMDNTPSIIRHRTSQTPHLASALERSESGRLQPKYGEREREMGPQQQEREQQQQEEEGVEEEGEEEEDELEEGNLSQSRSSGPAFEIQAVTHSLGGAALMVYIVTQCMQGKPHHLSHAILLSPAGFHEKTPMMFDVLGFLVPFLDFFFPRFLPGFYIPTRALRLLFNKLAQDFHELPALGALLQVVFSNVVVGGDPSDWVGALRMPHYTMYDMPGVAYRVMKHLAQMKAAKRFILYDYGSAAANIKAYGTPKPPDIGAHYGSVDIPVDIVSGRQDKLIPPQMVRRHYDALKAGGCHTTLQQFEYSHLDFTLAHKQELLSYVMSRLRLHSHFSHGLKQSKSCPRLPMSSAAQKRTRKRGRAHRRSAGAREAAETHTHPTENGNEGNGDHLAVRDQGGERAGSVALVGVRSPEDGDLPGW